MKDRNQFKMIMQLMFGVCLMLTSFQQTEAQDQCEDLCDPKACCETVEVGNKVPDPVDCYSYYQCITDGSGHVVPSDDSISCANGNYYSTEIADCTKGTECLIPCANRQCNTVCTADFETLAYPNDCTKYYVCVPNQYANPTATNCSDPTKPYFNGATCVDNPYQCCDICTPYCPEANIEVADPYNCEGYYLCLTANTKPSDDYKFSCSAGLYFDTTAGLCQPSDGQCKSICPS